MKNQTSPNTYTVKWLANFKESLFDDKGEVKALPIGNDLVTAFDWLEFSPDGNGRIIARRGYNCYGFTADLTPITLPLDKEQVTAFDVFDVYYSNGNIRVKYEGKFYGFTADLTPIALGKQVFAFDDVDFDRDGRMRGKIGAYWC